MSRSGPHLTTFRDLERHCRNTAKQAGYQRLLSDLGIDRDSFSRLVQHPRLILAEQPGTWFCGGDMMRFRLLRSLLETGRFHDTSGVMSLASDAFTCRGVKRLFMMLDFHPRLGPVPLLGAGYIRRHRNRIYSALPIAGAARRRIAAIFEVCDRMLAAAASSPDAFAQELIAIFEAGVSPGIRPLLPARSDRGSLRKLGVELAEYDLEAARQPIASARLELRDGDSWASTWDRINATFLGSEIGDLGALFNRFLLTVEDPHRAARRLMRLTDHPAAEPIPIAGIITDDEKYRMVFFDPTGSRFFYRPRGSRRQDLCWQEIRALAENGRTGGPSGVLEYLMMAACGIYLVADPGDGRSRFETQARKIHERYTGLPFPYVALTALDRKPPTDYLSIFRQDFEDNCQEALERFFE